MRANRHRTEDLSSCADVNFVTELRVATAFCADGHLMLEANISTATDSAIDDDTRSMYQHESGTEFSATADDAVTQNDIEFVEEQLERPQSNASRVLHAPIEHHRERAIAHHYFRDGLPRLVLVTPPSLRAEVIQNQRDTAP
jgi:hypothetical protein